MVMRVSTCTTAVRMHVNFKSPTVLECLAASFLTYPEGEASARPGQGASVEGASLRTVECREVSEASDVAKRVFWCFKCWCLELLPVCESCAIEDGTGKAGVGSAMVKGACTCSARGCVRIAEVF